jgi:hypothetical protein
MCDINQQYFMDHKVIVSLVSFSYICITLIPIVWRSSFLTRPRTFCGTSNQSHE